MNGRVERAGDRLVVSGSMTLSTAPTLLSDGLSGFSGGEPVFDLAGVGEMDSSGLAVLFGWQRAARSQGKTLKILNPPSNLISLAEVYGVAGLLPLA